MTGGAGRIVLVVLGLLLVLTYLLLRGAASDAALHERRLRAIDALILNQAALHRDVLRASHGLLHNYDPLVATVTRLREVAEELRGAGAAGPFMDSIAADLDHQEALVEEFKSTHALLRNSLTYFGHLSRELGTSTSQAGQDVAIVVGRLANSMFRFVGGDSDDAETTGRRTMSAARRPCHSGRARRSSSLTNEKPLVLLGEEMLATLGYEPIGFEKSSAALAAFRADPDRFDLVLTDELMPEMTGTEFAIALHDIRPELPIILMTGHGRPVEWRGLGAVGIREVLKKPLLSADLAKGLARHLVPRRRRDSG